MDLQLKGKTAFVFGASEGLGKAVALALSEEGARVAIASRNREKLVKAQKEVQAETLVECDLTQKGQAQKAIQQVMSEFKKIDILVMNTGGPLKNSFLSTSLEQWQGDFQNLWLSFVEATQYVLPEMQKQNYGRILLITSIAAKEPLAGLTTSNGLRAGLNGLAKSLSQEVASYGVTVNTLLPGYTATDRLKELNLSEERVKQLVPAGRLGDPRELASLAAFLASPRAAYITGQSIAVDGGVLRGH